MLSQSWNPKSSQRAVLSPRSRGGFVIIRSGQAELKNLVTSELLVRSYKKEKKIQFLHPGYSSLETSLSGHKLDRSISSIALRKKETNEEDDIDIDQILETEKSQQEVMEIENQLEKQSTTTTNIKERCKVPILQLSKLNMSRQLNRSLSSGSSSSARGQPNLSEVDVVRHDMIDTNSSNTFMPIFNMWHWEASDGSLMPYTLENQVIITRDRSMGKINSKVIIQDKSYTLDYINLIQTCDEDPSIINHIVCVTPVVGLLKRDYSQQDCYTSVEVEDLQLLALPSTHEEYIKIENKCRETMVINIISIKKIFNPRLQAMFDLELRNVMHKNNQNPSIEYVKELFHGTGKTKPDKIYHGERGFMVQFAAEGMWGRGTYFSKSADYADNYAYTTKKGNRQILLSQVIIGVYKKCSEDRNLRLPPEKSIEKSKLKFKAERYDSVKGKTHGSTIYVVYENNKAYPGYIITYEAPPALHNA